MLSLGLRGIQGRVAAESYLDYVTLPGQEEQRMVVAVPAGRGDDGSGMLRSRTVLLDDSGHMWLKHSRNVHQPERIEKLDSMLRSLADWRAAEILQEVVTRVEAASDAQQVRRLMTSDKEWD